MVSATHPPLQSFPAASKLGSPFCSGRQSYNILLVFQLFLHAEDLEDLVGDVAVFLDAAEFAGAGAVGEQGDHHGGVALGGEDAGGEAVFGVGAAEDGGAGFVVGADDHQGVAVFFREADGGFDGFVEVQHFFHRAFEVVGVFVFVDAGAFDHQEEALPAAPGQVVDGQFGGGGQVVAAVQFHALRQIDEALGGGHGGVGGVVHHLEAALDGFPGAQRHGFEGGLRAGGGEGEAARREIGPDFFLVAAGGLVGEERGRGGAVEVVGGQYAAGVAQRGEVFGDVGDVPLGGVFAEVAVVGLDARGVGGAGGGGVGGEVVRGLGADVADGAQVGEGEGAAVGVHARVHGALAHAVADQQDDVADAGVLAVDPEGGGVGALLLYVHAAPVGLYFLGFRALCAQPEGRCQQRHQRHCGKFQCVSHGYYGKWLYL